MDATQKSPGFPGFFRKPIILQKNRFRTVNDLQKSFVSKCFKKRLTTEKTCDTILGQLELRYARVVELVDSLDSGSSAHSGHAGSSPASRTKKVPKIA